MNPLVSVAIPTFDRLHYLKEAVSSALAQTYDNIEVIIGDDGETESIKAWSQNITRQEPRVRYQRNPHNLGLAGNWNALADAARGEFLIIIGDDDRLLPHFASTLVKTILPSARVAFSNHYLIDDKGNRLEAESYQHTRLYRRDTLPAGQIANAAACVWQNLVPMSAALVRTSDVQRLRFRDDLNTPETEFFIRLAQEGARFIFAQDYLSEYRVHSQSQTTAGLSSERMAEYLLPVSVAPDVEPYKREFMAPLLINAVSRCLQNGEWQRARKFLSSEYYPKPSDTPTSLKYVLSGCVQELCASLPAPVGYPIYRSAQRIKSFSEKFFR